MTAAERVTEVQSGAEELDGDKADDEQVSLIVDQEQVWDYLIRQGYGAARSRRPRGVVVFLYEGSFKL